MRLLRKLTEQPVGLMIGFVVASVLFLAAFGLALTSGRVLATHSASGNVHACVSLYTSQTRVIIPGQPPNCTAQEILVEWPGTALAADLTELEARMDAIEAQVPDCLSDVAGDAVFSGCNVQVVNGLDETDTTNGTGNLIVGYNENLFLDERTGSHNLVVGPNHGYTSYGGFVAGFRNRVSGPYSSVSGGSVNEASGNTSSVLGGQDNTTSGDDSTVSGGWFNDATGNQSSVSGGFGNEAGGNGASVSGGANRSAPSLNDWAAGTLSEDF